MMRIMNNRKKVRLRQCLFALLLTLVLTSHYVSAGAGKAMEETQSYRVVMFFLFFLVASVILETSLHHFEHYLEHHNLHGINEGLEKVKEELMLMGFISLMLICAESKITAICVSKPISKTLGVAYLSTNECKNLYGHYDGQDNPRTCGEMCGKKYMECTDLTSTWNGKDKTGANSWGALSNTDTVPSSSLKFHSAMLAGTEAQTDEYAFQCFDDAKTGRLSKYYNDKKRRRLAGALPTGPVPAILKAKLFCCPCQHDDCADETKTRKLFDVSENEHVVVENETQTIEEAGGFLRGVDSLHIDWTNGYTTSISSKNYFIPTHGRRLAGGGGCKEGEEGFIEPSALHEAHTLIFIIACIHLVYTSLVMTLAQIRTNQFKKWENVTKDNLDTRKELKRPKTYGTGFCAHLMMCVVYLFEQFYVSVDFFGFLAMRRYYIAKHDLYHDFDFCSHLRSGLQHDFKEVMGIRAWMWTVPMIMVFAEGYGYGKYNIFGYLGIGVTLMVGTKLQMISRVLSAQIFDHYDTDGDGTLDMQEFKKLEFNDDDHLEGIEPKFWFNAPAILLFFIQLVMWLNAVQMGFIIFFSASYGGDYHDSCYIKSRGTTLVTISIVWNFVTFFCIAFINMPLYSLVTHMGSHQKAKGLIAITKMTAIAKKGGLHHLTDPNKMIKMMGSATMSSLNVAAKITRTDSLVHKAHAGVKGGITRSMSRVGQNLGLDFSEHVGDGHGHGSHGHGDGHHGHGLHMPHMPHLPHGHSKSHDDPNGSPFIKIALKPDHWDIKTCIQHIGNQESTIDDQIDTCEKALKSLKDYRAKYVSEAEEKGGKLQAIGIEKSKRISKKISGITEGGGGIIPGKLKGSAKVAPAPENH